VNRAHFKSFASFSQEFFAETDVEQFFSFRAKYESEADSHQFQSQRHSFDVSSRFSVKVK
jgi:hypothetical protein